MKKWDFLKIIAIGVVISMAGFLPVKSESSKHRIIQKEPVPMVMAGIGCLIGDVDVEIILENLQSSRDYDIVIFEKIDEVFMNQPCSAFVIDRHLIGKANWKDYMNLFSESAEDTPLVIVDDIRNWIVPGRGV